MMNTQPLTSCETEQIHQLSKIQQLGILLVVNYDEYKIVQTSDNCAAIFKLSPDEILNKPLSQFVCQEIVIKLNTIANEKNNVEKSYTFHYEFEESNLFFVFHLETDYIIVEISDSHLNENEVEQNIEKIIGTAINHCETTLDFKQLLNAITFSVQKISGFDRVLLYKFDEDYNGTVLAESTRNFDEIYLEHRFPASDIPPQARALYTINRFRIIENVYEENSILTPTINSITNKPLNMSKCFLRGVSPIHIEYLKNMKVESSMSISIVINGNLWGLIACHHPKPKTIPLTFYKTYHLLSNIFSAQINQKEIFTNYKKITELQLAREIFITTLNAKKENTFYEALEPELEKLQKIILANECIIVENETIIIHNSQLKENEIQNIFHILKSNMSDSMICTTSNMISFVPDILSYSKIIGGGLLLKIPTIHQQTYVLFLKYEQIINTKWAGDPKKEVTFKDGKIIINPRASFDSWKETVRGTSALISNIKIESAKTIAIELANSIELFKVYDETRRAKEETKTFQEQKLISMGEMIENIAHQWRQPLSVVSTIASGIQLKQEYGIFELQNLSSDMENIVSQANYLSKTIDDFRGFLKANDNMEQISIKTTLEHTISITHSSLKNNHIKLIQNIDEDIVLEGHENELIQAFINIINNSKDALIECCANSHNDRFIFIKTQKTKYGFEIIFQDNGGGIEQNAISRIFEPYFTTKHKSVGTDIGLSMTHNILTKRHKAKIEAKNIEFDYQSKLQKGACFIILFETLNLCK